MAIVTNGSVLAIHTGGQAPEPLNVDIPIGTTAALLFWVGYASGLDLDISSARIDSLPFTLSADMAGQASYPATGDNTGVGVVLLTAPPTGPNRKLSWTWSNPPDTGVVLYLVCVKSRGVVQLRDAKALYWFGLDTKSVSIASNDGDLIIAIMGSADYDPTLGSVGDAVDLLVNNDSYNHLVIADVAKIRTAKIGTTTVGGFAAYGVLQVVALKEFIDQTVDRAPLNVVPEGPYYMTQGDERLDQVAQYVYGFQLGAVEALLIANPGLATVCSGSLDLILPAGIAIMTPALAQIAPTQIASSREVSLWG